MKNVGIRFVLAALCIVALATVGLVVRADDDDDLTTFRARLADFGEVPPQLTGGTGTFHGTLSPDGTRINWTLTYTGMTAGPLFAHIHFAPRGVNGGVVVFFCSGPATTATVNGGTPVKPCPDNGAAHSGTVTGFWTAADVQAVTGQNVSAGAFAGLLRFLRAGLGYCNVHTPAHPGGEIRGQVRAHREDHDDD